MVRSGPEPKRDSRMRYLTGVLRPVEATHPIERALAESHDLTPVAIHENRLHEDDVCITLLQVRGDRERLHDLLSTHPAVEEFMVAGGPDTFVYLRSEPNELSRLLLTAQAESEVVVRMPLEHTGDGGLRGTLIGENEAFQRFADTLPDEVDLEVERIGDYHPDVRDVFSSLTARQQDVLATAIRNGYYEDPRRATQHDLADVLDIAPGTVNQHLRRIEAKVFSAFTVEPGGGDGDPGH